MAKIALGRSLIRKNIKMIILDEPTSNLDQIIEESIIDTLMKNKGLYYKLYNNQNELFGHYSTNTVGDVPDNHDKCP